MIATVSVTVDDDPDEDDHMAILLHDLAAARAKTSPSLPAKGPAIQYLGPPMRSWHRVHDLCRVFRMQVPEEYTDLHYPQSVRLHILKAQLPLNRPTQTTRTRTRIPK